MQKHFTFLLITLIILMQPVKAQLDMAFISDFKASFENSIAKLSWTIANNQGVKTFDIERSVNGRDFKTIGILKATEKFNAESYTYSDTINAEKIMYRIRMVSKNLHEFYSNIIFVKSSTILTDDIKIFGNPVKDDIRVNYFLTEAQKSDIKIYNFWGRVVFKETISSMKGNNLLTIPLGSDFFPGIYILEISHGLRSQTKKFIKQ